jgi:hypothetical protein
MGSHRHPLIAAGTKPRDGSLSLMPDVKRRNDPGRPRGGRKHDCSNRSSPEVVKRLYRYDYLHELKAARELAAQIDETLYRRSVQLAGNLIGSGDFQSRDGRGIRKSSKPRILG